MANHMLIAKKAWIFWMPNLIKIYSWMVTPSGYSEPFLQLQLFRQQKCWPLFVLPARFQATGVERPPWATTPTSNQVHHQQYLPWSCCFWPLYWLEPTHQYHASSLTAWHPSTLWSAGKPWLETNLLWTILPILDWCIADPPSTDLMESPITPNASCSSDKQSSRSGRYRINTYTQGPMNSKIVACSKQLFTKFSQSQARPHSSRNDWHIEPDQILSSPTCQAWQWVTNSNSHMQSHPAMCQTLHTGYLTVLPSKTQDPLPTALDENLLCPLSRIFIN